MTIAAIAIDTKAHHRVLFADGTNSDGWLLVFDAITSRGHQVMNGPTDQFMPV